ncbi:UNVERIFIED_CONTAM: TonB-dependent receptor, partial [Prevotella sp. 15_C9]
VKTGKDIFAPITLDPTTGFSSMVANVASIRNNGIELAIGYDWFVPGNRRGFSWTTNLTVTYNKNKVLEVENPATRAYDLVSLPYKTGYPV